MKFAIVYCTCINTHTHTCTRAWNRDLHEEEKHGDLGDLGHTGRQMTPEKKKKKKQRQGKQTRNKVDFLQDQEFALRSRYPEMSLFLSLSLSLSLVKSRAFVPETDDFIH